MLVLIGSVFSFDRTETHHDGEFPDGSMVSSAQDER